MYGVSITIFLLSIVAMSGLAIVCYRLLEKSDSRVVVGVLVLTVLLVIIDLVFFAVPVQSCAIWRKSCLLIEGLLVPAWLFCSLVFARKPGQWTLTSRFVRAVTLVSPVLALLPLFLSYDYFYYSPDFPAEPLLFLTSLGFSYYVTIMVCFVVALVQFEATFTNASPQAFWNVKFFLIGLCLILAVQVFYYSQALLYRTVNMEYGVFRALMFLVASFLMFFSLVKRDLSTRIVVSQHVALKSVSLFAVALYLIILGGFGEGLKYFSGQFSRSFGVSLIFLIGLVLLLLFLSGRVRREIKVILHKHFYQNKYDYRTQWLLFTEQLSSTDKEEMLHSVLEMYCSTFGTSGAALFLLDEHRAIYSVASISRMDLTTETIQPDNSLVLFMRNKGWVYCASDKISDIVQENGSFLEEHKVSFVIPLMGDDTRLEGFILLGRLIKPDENYIYEDFDLMKTYARQAYQTIRQHRLAQALLFSREEAAIGNVATFIMHDLKNQLAAISLITENAPRLISNPDYQKDLVVSLQATVKNMQSLIGNLKTLHKDKLLHLEQVDLMGLIEDCTLLLPGNQITVFGNREFAAVDRNEIQKVVMNLLVNGIEASGPDKPIDVEVGASTVDGHLFIRVQDRGCGMTQEFIKSELFVPFNTTKSSGLGIGLFQSRQIIQAHGGKIVVESSPETGSTFTIWLPRSGVLHVTT